MSNNKQYFDYDIKDEYIKNLADKNYIINTKDGNHLRAKGINVIELFIKTENEGSDGKYDKMTDNYRELFKGLKTGSMGDRNAVKGKLIRFMKDNPNTSFSEVKSAVKEYIESLNGNYKYIRRADYFIYKQTSRKNEEISDLTTWVEEIRKEPENSDWRVKLC
jgi:hypothetical protein|tara:strand:+ start:2790 stop:3278 length:489 start_codon:yes stop_codon:yes gene_type:complete